MRRTKIVATIGPACREPEVLVRLVEAGMDVARLNFSHGTHEEHFETAERVRAAANRAGRPVAILQDLPGPKLRIGPVRDGSVVLPARTNVKIFCGDVEGREGDETTLYIDWPGLARAVGVGEVMYLADG